MNLELIKKYEKEFLHMLHGGTLLSRVMTSDEDGEMYTIWYKVDDKVLALENGLQIIYSDSQIKSVHIINHSLL